MTSKSLRKSEKALVFKVHHHMATRSGNREWIFNVFRGGDFRLLAASSLILAFVLLQTVSASEFCAGNSAIDQVPFFIGQTFADVLNRTPGGEGERYWASRLEERNAQTCRSGKPAVLADSCEWKNAAQIVVEILNTPESVSKNGRVSSNNEFVTTLYRLLLRRAAEDAGLKSHLAILGSGGTRPSVVMTFLSGEEYRRRFTCHEETRESVVGTRERAELGVTGHPLTQPAYSDSNGVSFDDQLAQVQRLGATWYRFDVGTGVDFTKMDQLVKKAQAHQVQLLPVIIPPIDRVHDNPSTAYRKSYDGAVNIVSHYKSSIHVWELANEEDIRTLQGAASGDKITDYDPQKYALVREMLRGLANGVRAADGSARRMINFGGWLHTGFFQRLEDDGVPYDIVGIHWYQEMGEITCPGQSYPCPAKLQHFNVVQRLQTITHGKPMWITETNYRPLASNSVEANISRKQEYLVPTVERYLKSPALYPFQVVMIYELLDEPYHANVAEQQYGFFSVTHRPDGGYAMGRAKPTYQSVQRLVKR